MPAFADPGYHHEAVKQRNQWESAIVNLRHNSGCQKPRRRAHKCIPFWFSKNNNKGSLYNDVDVNM